MFTKIKWSFWTWVSLVITTIFVVFLILPIFSLVLSSFQNPETGAWTLEHFSRFFSHKYYYETLLNSLVVASVSTGFAILLGVPLAYIMNAFEIKGKSFIEICIILSMLSPPFIGAYSWVLLLGRNGILTRFIKEVLNLPFESIYGFGGIVLVFSLKLFPLIYIYTSGAIKKIDASLLEAAENLGCSPVKRVFTILVPLLMPTILAGSLLVFMNAIADFGTPMLIGEGYRVMPVVIYGEFIGEVGGEARFAAALAVMMMLLTMVLFLLQKYFVAKKSFIMNALIPMRTKTLSLGKNILAHSFVYFLILLAILPQIVVIITSFLKIEDLRFVQKFSLESYQLVFKNASSAIWNTFTFSTVAIMLIIILGVFIAYMTVRNKNTLNSFIDTVSMLPYIIPGSVLGITLLLAFNKPPLILSGTATLLIISYTIRRLPYTLRSSAAILYQINPNIEEASISLGAPPVKTFFRVTLLMMMPGVMSGALLSWITVINELSASIIIFTGNTKTMSVAIYGEVVRASYGTAAALATLLTLFTIVLLTIFIKISNKKISII